jgi:UDP-N-acetyl-D-galactosamine dehydrogenase
MTLFKLAETRIAVIGLGYVGLPLALALARHFPVIGYDASAARLKALRAGLDGTGEVEAEALGQSTLQLVDAPEGIAACNLFIVTVPTPIDADNTPDLSALVSASRTVGGQLAPGAVVVFESTVYPGVTEDVCGPELESASGLECGQDFFLGYSPERINPGDRVHTVDKIIKVVAGQTPEVAALLGEVYGKMVGAGIHMAPDIRTAEAAKVIENAQRDINIAFINEVTMIFQRMGIDTQGVLAAAQTKWNFLDFRPGLVGGHCIGVDPFYLAHAAKEVGHEPEVILAGRRINDGMAGFVAGEIDRRLGGAGRVLVLGLTFKENVPDLRNSKVADLVAGLRAKGHSVDVFDPIAEPAEAEAIYGIRLLADLGGAAGYNAVVGAVAHKSFGAMDAGKLAALLAPDGLLADLKGIWNGVAPAPGIRCWRL